MTSRTSCAALLLLLSLLLLLAQCKPKDPTPPLPKAGSTPSTNIGSAWLPR